MLTGNNKYGHVEISKAVIAKIVSEETEKYDGRLLLRGKKLRQTPLGRLMQLGAYEEARDIEIEDGEDGLYIKIFIVIKFGSSISRLCGEYIDGIQKSLTDFMGEEASRISLNIRGVFTNRHVLPRNIILERNGATNGGKSK